MRPGDRTRQYSNARLNALSTALTEPKFKDTSLTYRNSLDEVNNLMILHCKDVH